MKKFKADIFDLLNDSCTEIENYCEENSWVNEIRSYIKNWSEKQVLEWKSIGAFEIDDQLNRIKNWIEMVKNNIDKTILTKNLILKIDTTAVEKFLVPNLESIYSKICECVMKETNKDINSFISQMNKILKVNLNI